ncbi:hypothetical protein GGR58DRAFT_160262 [Xylaria digitata]|nr:hypothetical protein GGR58DRAFT_160262 [Xylaria digitata]
MLTSISIASSCITQTWLSWDLDVNRAAIVLGNPHDSNCWPGNQDLDTTITPAVCPNGYTSACDITDASRRDRSETIWACCPSQYQCDDGFWKCINDHTPGVMMTLIVTDTDTLGNITTPTTLWASGVNAHSVRVAFHSSDLESSSSPTSESSTPSVTRTTTILGVPSATPARTLTSPFPTSTSESASAVPNSESLAPGAWAGIGVGSGLGVIILVLGIVWLVRRKSRERRQQLSGPQDASQGATEPSSETRIDYVHEIYSATQTPELKTTPGPYERAELNAAPGPYELESRGANTASINGRYTSGIN